MRITIIGAGINGLYLAWKLSQKNHQVTIFERKKEIGDNIICSGLFSQRILDFIPQSEKLIQNRINSVFLYFPQKTISVKFSKDFFVMDHSRLDKLLANLARNQGAKLVLNYNINKIPDNFDRVIGCDGANSFVRKSLGLKDPKYKLGILRVEENRSLPNGRERFSSTYVEVWPCKKGFSWKIPKGENIEQGFINELPETRVSGNFKQAKVIPQGLIIPNNNLITLCGDAAGLTKPWSGGGVIWGLLAADILLKTFPDFRKYRKLAKRFFLPKIILSKTAVKLVYFSGFNMPWILPKQTRIESDFLL